MNLDNLYAQDLVDATESRLKMVFDGVYVAPTKNIDTGTVTLGEDTFAYSAGHLRLMGFCAVCGQEVMSKPIRRLADIADQKRNFRPEKHECMDV
jgi:hypothetical protein